MKDAKMDANLACRAMTTYEAQIQTQLDTK